LLPVWEKFTPISLFLPIIFGFLAKPPYMDGGKNPCSRFGRDERGLLFRPLEALGKACAWGPVGPVGSQGQGFLTSFKGAALSTGMATIGRVLAFRVCIGNVWEKAI
jgi:hypothetical protein